ncbi:riboflavin synthase [Propionibacteriaceae bacterium Y1923]
MFTGIVEEVGTVLTIEQQARSAVLAVTGPLVTSDAAPGDSICVNGVCLTVVDLVEGHDGRAFSVDVMAETLDRSSLGGLQVGSPVNLERAMPATGRFSGHIVQGHVDGTGRIIEIVPGEKWQVVKVSLDPTLSRYVVEKGSISLDGVSLTVASTSEPGAEQAWFTVSLIPTTLAGTILGTARVGQVVNLEVDVLAKYVERMLAREEGLPVGVQGVTPREGLEPQR